METSETAAQRKKQTIMNKRDLIHIAFLGNP
jgi:hypothetical protein